MDAPGSFFCFFFFFVCDLFIKTLLKPFVLLFPPQVSKLGVEELAQTPPQPDGGGDAAAGQR